MWIQLQTKNEYDIGSLSTTGAAQHSKDDEFLNMCGTAGNECCMLFLFLF